MKAIFKRIAGPIGILLIKRSFILSSFYIVLQALNSILGLAAMLLPLKIILVMGSENIPSYFPFWFQQFDRVGLVLFLAKSAIFAYVLSILIGKLAKLLMRKTALRLFRESKLLAKRHDDEASATWFYLTSLRALSSVFLAVLMVSGIGLVYKNSALVVVSSIAVFMLILAMTSLMPFGKKLLADERNQFVTNFGALVFFVNFSFLIVDNIYLGYEGYYSAILALIMSRHAGNQFFRCVNDFRYLYIKGDKGLVALNLLDDVDSRGENLTNVSDILDALCREGLLKQGVSECSLIQVQSGIRNVNVYKLHVHGEVNSVSYVKVFKDTAKKQFYNEVAFLNEVKFKIAPPLLGVFSVSDSVGALYRWEPTGHLEWHPFKKQKAVVLADLATNVVPEKLKTLYLSSEPSLQNKCDSIKNQLTQVESFDDTTNVIKTWVGVCDYLKKHSKKMAIGFFNPDIRMETLYVSGQDCVISHWGRWSIGYIGEGWPLADAEFAACVDNLLSVNPKFSVTVSEVRFAALVSYAVSQYEKGNMLSFNELCKNELKIYIKGY